MAITNGHTYPYPHPYLTPTPLFSLNASPTTLTPEWVYFKVQTVILSASCRSPPEILRQSPGEFHQRVRQREATLLDQGKLPEEGGPPVA